MKFKKSIAIMAALVIVFLLAFTGCGEVKPTNSIALVDEQTVLKVTEDMTRSQLYELFGNTYGQPLSDQKGFLATYIIANRYIYSVSIYNDVENDSALGYNGEALMKSLELNGRTVTTQHGMTVSAEKDFDPASKDKGFEIEINYDGTYTCALNNYELSVNNKALATDKKLKGKNTVVVDIKKAAENTASASANAVEGVNSLLGILTITNEADENVYIELYNIGTSLYICRVRQ